MDLTPRSDLNLILDPFKAYSFVLIGSTRSGKSTILNFIMEKYMKGKINILMTESPNGDVYQKGSFKKDCIMSPTYMPEIIKECYLINKGTNNRYPFNFIMDDLVGFRSDKQMKKLLTIYRNSNMGEI
jgi:ABC-type phosphate/phosphonate transport system ATPase subunit